MAYPKEQPSAKCDLVSPRLQGGSLNDFPTFESTASLFQAFQKPLPTDLKLLATLYLYPSDAPNPPMSRSLAIIGVANVSLSVVRKLIVDADAERLPNGDCLWTKSTVAVRRADGRHANMGMDARHEQNSQAFSRLMRRLHKEQVVAMIAPDKYGRFGILAPAPGLIGEGITTSEEDYYGHVYMGKVEAVKEYLAQSIIGAPAAATSATTDGASELWSPPGTSSSDVASDGLWQPPGSDAAGADALWQPSGSTTSTYDFASAAASANESHRNGHKRKHDEFHDDSGAAAADAFYSSLTRTLETRADSRIYHMRAFNGWVKATQIQELNPKTNANRDGPLRVLDLACGKGGDLGKWTLHSRGIGNYVGSDVARGSLKDAAIRARKMRQKLKKCTFTCADLGADVPGRVKGPKHKHMQKLLTWSLHNEPSNCTREPKFQLSRGGGIAQEDLFDVVSIQFAIHYMMSSKKRARRFFQTVGELLDVGGNLIITTIDARMVVWHLMNLGIELHSDEEDLNKTEDDAVISVGNGACKLRFKSDVVRRVFKGSGEDITSDDLFGLEYSFTLIEGDDHSQGVGDAVNLPEWLTPVPVLSAIAKDAGLELESAENFHDFYKARSDSTRHASAHSSMYNMKVLNRNGSIADDEWEISHMYVALKYRKVRVSTMQVDDSDDEEEDETPEDQSAEVLRNIDPKVKMKLMPMAMIKAKKGVGVEAWQGLSSVEKSRLTDIELSKLAIV
jgi:SAM-dependent methyltransferase